MQKRAEKLKAKVDNEVAEKEKERERERERDRALMAKPVEGVVAADE